MKIIRCDPAIFQQAVKDHLHRLRQATLEAAWALSTADNAFSLCVDWRRRIGARRRIVGLEELHKAARVAGF